MPAQSKQLQRKSGKTFNKKDFSSVAADWTGSETYWTATGDKVYTTNVGVDPSFITLRHLQSTVSSTEVDIDYDFPDSGDWNAGSFNSYSEYATITKREVHIFDKVGSFPNRWRIDAYNGTTLLCQYYFFRDFSDSKVFKVGFRIRHVVVPSNFEFYYDVSDDTPFNDYGIVIAGQLDDNITSPAAVAGNTYYFSIPTAYLPEGRALVGGANDMSARVLAFAALVIAFFAVIYAVMNANSSPKKQQ